MPYGNNHERETRTVQNLTTTTVLTDSTRFAIVDEDTVTVTAEQWEHCTEWFKAESAKRGETTGRGRLPLAETLTAWHEAGMPVINSDELRNQRLWVAEAMGKETLDGIDWDSERVRKLIESWESMDKPEAVRFLPKGVKAKFIGRILVDGKITEDERTVYVSEDALNEYREANEVTGPSGQDTYRGAAADELAELAIHTLVTPTKVYSYGDDGKPVPVRKALESENEKLRRELAEKAEREAAIKAALDSGDFERVKELMAGN